MKARYVPSGGRIVDRIHEWDARYGGYAAKSACGAMTVMTDRLVKTDEPVTCKGCVAWEVRDERAIG